MRKRNQARLATLGGRWARAAVLVSALALLALGAGTARARANVSTNTQSAELLATDGQAGDALGYAVAASGPLLVAGAPYHSVAGLRNAGAAYVYAKQGSGSSATFREIAELTASGGRTGDEFGSSVAISGNTIVVGAPDRTIDGRVEQGAVYVFQQPAWSGQLHQTTTLGTSTGQTGDQFGAAVAVAGSTVVVGAPYHAPAGNAAQGSLYVFTMPSRGWANSVTAPAELTASTGQPGDHLGQAVAVSGSVVVGGAPEHAVGGASARGVAEVFRQPSRGWTGSVSAAAELTETDGNSGDQLGTAVAVSGNVIVAGAPYHAVGSTFHQGVVAAFTMPAGGWSGGLGQKAELTASDGGAGDDFGLSAAITPGTLVVGSPFHTVGPNYAQGDAYSFTVPSAGWSGAVQQSTELIASDGMAHDQFGSSVGVAGSMIVAGAPYRQPVANFEQGAAYLFLGPGT